MLGALIYEEFRCFIKKKSNVVFSILGIAMVLGMIFLTGFISSESDIARNPSVVAAGIAVISIVAFDFTLTQISSGDLLFSTADAHYFLVGPFTPRFNLLLPVIASLKTAILFMFILSCQGALISSLLRVNALDMIILLVAFFVVSALGYTFSQIVNALAYDKKVVRYAIEGVIIAIQVVWIGIAFYSLYNQAGSIVGIKDLGLETILETLNGNIAIKFVPFAGWISLIVDGIYTGSVIKLILGIVLIAAGVAILAIITNVFDLDYYERAVETAQKLQQRVAAQKAGVDGNAQLTTNIKNDGKKHVGGFGADVFFYKHLNENTRTSKFFFVNKLSLVYKVFVLIYVVFMTNTSFKDDKSTGVVMALFMLLLLNTVVFAGGKTVVELTRPYFFLVPEKTSKKLLFAILGGVPEMVFDAVLATGIIAWQLRDTLNPIIIIGSVVFFTLYNLLCTYIAIVATAIFPHLGKTLLTLVRYGAFWFIAGTGAIVLLVAKIFIDFSYGGGFLIAAGVTLVYVLIASLITSKLVDRIEIK